LIASLLTFDGVPHQVRWRPPLFRCLVSVLVDPERSLRQAAYGCLFETLLPKEAKLNLAYSHFLELLFALNGCPHAPHLPRALPEPERKVVEMIGPGRNQRRRLHILRLLLHSLGDEHKLQLTARLCQDVLAAVVDGTLPLDGKAEAVLGDALLLLSSKEIKLGSGGAAAADEDEAADGGAAGGAAGGTAGKESEMRAKEAAAKSRLLSQVERKAMVESIVPIIIELKRTLEAANSPQLRLVFVLVRELLRDHKAQLQDIFARDRQLAAEVEYDMRSLRSNAPSQALLPLSPHSFTPSSEMRPGAISRTSLTPSAALSAARDGRAVAEAAPEVPTPDCMQRFSVPKLAKISGGRGSVGSSGRASLSLSGTGSVNVNVNGLLNSSPVRLPLAPRTASALQPAGAALNAAPDEAAPKAPQPPSPQPMGPPPARVVVGARRKAAATATAPSRAARASRRGDNGAPPPEVPSADVLMSSPEKPVTARRQWLTSPYQQGSGAEGGGLFEGVEEGI
jgi:hypothetical protein